MRATAPYFRASVVALAIAMLTGALFRGMVAWGWDLRVALPNVRHAHSHLMFFGWVSPAIMAMIAARVSSMTGRAPSAGMHHAIGASLVLGIASWPLFLVYGYTSAQIGSARVPPAVIVSGLAMIAWYGFALAYARATRGLSRRGRPGSGALVAWDLAIGMLCISTVAAWSLAMIRPLGLDPAYWTPILMHAFVDPFSEGWLVLGVLGIVRAQGRTERSTGSLWLIALGAPLAFALAAPQGSLPLPLRMVGALGGIAWSIGLLREVSVAQRSLPLALGALAALARLVVSASPWIDWTAWTGLRLVYLHVLLLGFVSLALLELARVALGVSVRRTLVRVAALAVIASLLPLSEISPWTGIEPLRLAALVALAPPLVLAYAMTTGTRAISPSNSLPPIVR